MPWTYCLKWLMERNLFINAIGHHHTPNGWQIEIDIRTLK